MSINLTNFDYLWIGLIVFIILAIIVWQIAKRLGRPEIEADSLEKIKQQWAEIEKLVEQNSPLSWKMAVLEADKILDYALKSLGLPGKDMGERVRAAGFQYPEIRRVWPAHQVRNRLVHETDYTLDRRTAKESMEKFKQALKMLRVL